MLRGFFLYPNDYNAYTTKNLMVTNFDYINNPANQKMLPKTYGPKEIKKRDEYPGGEADTKPLFVD
ncbi:MAG: hypothetical protein A7316_03985 [Candidatus Altiarchaeales archaeon WOR_SM1_86-2]|nr:MAG: hypothetical protein A7316_03985 [Candidatus Altiarchaeales archaeon WOR_SM1_86-2]ODS39152.1 MAG: hypothetical protein A7315_11455 [Candidatus Altiarchaeales archaeon WOR_SM1_79]